ncbi:hypothetical protein BHE74_00012400 [Ensete ventricosum]|nr:hypothetical protein BHE74_00012400 [Ensete ventricosum]RZS14436.1 hypothetical protein BHM03_00046120 [Ensete ventricosum]
MAFKLNNEDSEELSRRLCLCLEEEIAAERWAVKEAREGAAEEEEKEGERQKVGRRGGWGMGEKHRGGGGGRGRGRGAVREARLGAATEEAEKKGELQREGRKRDGGEDAPERERRTAGKRTGAK